MNKKIVCAIAALTLSSFAHADVTPLTKGGATLIAASACDLLSEDVTINLSKDVLGAVECNETGKILAIATCHATGRQKATIPVADAEGVVTDSPVTQGIIYTASSEGGKISLVEGSGCSAAPEAAATAAAGVTEPPPGD